LKSQQKNPIIGHKNNRGTDTEEEAHSVQLSDLDPNNDVHSTTKGLLLLISILYTRAT